MKDLIPEYQADLKAARKCLAKLQKIIDLKTPPLEHGQKRKRNAIPEDAIKSKLNSIIDSTQYALEWIEKGYEPGLRRPIERRSMEQREIKIEDVEVMRKWFIQTHGLAYEMVDESVEIAEWDRIKMEDAMSTLSEQEKKAILLRYEENLSWNQVADKMEISVRSVRSYADRAKKKIQERLDKNLYCMAI
ncbi:sigma-70 family RNA polymerase sigma factor [Listeria sp. FSL L7-1582]|uniref:sigma-70 family RNA polymerase sigma factor n=1 Tax=Listeria portnoyi TaxID=2713504 RepID=UPI00164D1388|nr:sigma-70 family RNA polymerase sigma factor [Listeria portnoyi]